MTDQPSGTRRSLNWDMAAERVFCARCLMLAQLTFRDGGGVKMVLSGDQNALSRDDRMTFQANSGPNYGWEALQQMIMAAQLVETHESRPRVYWYSNSGYPCGIWAVTMDGGTALCQYHITRSPNEHLRR